MGRAHSSLLCADSRPHDRVVAGHIYSSDFAPLHLLAAQSDYRKNSSGYEIDHTLTQPYSLLLQAWRLRKCFIHEVFAANVATAEAKAPDGEMQWGKSTDTQRTSTISGEYRHDSQNGPTIRSRDVPKSPRPRTPGLRMETNCRQTSDLHVDAARC
jgi:hypothetical protein